MRFIIILILPSLILLAAAILFDINYINYKPPIPYSEWPKINFYDFRALKKPGVTLSGVKEFAYIKTNRIIYYLNNGDVEIITYFHPSRSYVFAQDIRSADLLKHELYHFHISEYYSRLLRKEVFNQRNRLTKSEMEDLRRKYYLLENKEQDEYDENSYHSYVMKEQRKWEIKIDSMLQSLEEFSKPVVHMVNRE